MKTALFPLAIALLAPAAALASPVPASDPMAAFYGATLELQVPAGQYRAIRFYEPDHTFRDIDAGGERTGTWTLEGDRVCARFSAEVRYCNLGPGHAAGDTWREPDLDSGAPLIFTLKPGRAGSTPAS